MIRCAMNRNEAIATITEHLSSLDDDGVQAVADLVTSMAATDSVLPRDLTPRELALIEQSKEDFKAGRTVFLDDYKAEMEIFWAGMHVKQSSKA